MYRQRRIQVMESMEEESSLFIFSGSMIMRSEDEGYPFDVNRNFYYLTGLNQEEMILHLQKHAGRITSVLFIQPYDEMLARWVGGRISKAEAKRISGVDAVVELESFHDSIASLYNRMRSYPDYTVYVDGWMYSASQSDSRAMRFVKKLQEERPLLKIKDCFSKITAMRMIKDEAEINEIIKANEITRDGVVAMMKNIGDNQREMVMEGIFNLELMKQGCKLNAFPTIAASGKNATVLHYSSNADFCHDGDLFLCDLGATSHYYCADVSRTFPVNGKFTERQKQIYNTVLEAQKIVEENCKPGMTLRQLNQLVVEFYQSKLEELSLTQDVSEYYFHGVSHHLGLDTHDVTLEGVVLAPGMVITNEPGLYLSEEGIGVRIEDDLLITENGCRNLTCTPKTIEEIEKIMEK